MDTDNAQAKLINEVIYFFTERRATESIKVICILHSKYNNILLL